MTEIKANILHCRKIVCGNLCIGGAVLQIEALKDIAVGGDSLCIGPRKVLILVNGGRSLVCVGEFHRRCRGVAFDIAVIGKE